MLNSNTQGFSRTEKIWFFIIIITSIVASFVNLGLIPLQFEEPRRAMIALEMMFSNNWITPTQVGDYYYNKPPLYNWLLIAFVKLFNSQSEFVFRFSTPLSHFAMVYVTYLFTKKYVNPKVAVYASLLYLVSSHYFLHFAINAEIDVFYSLITLLFFFVLFHFYEKEQYYALFISTYFLTALGVLTKGFPSFVFLGFSFLAFFIYHKKFWKLFSLAHFVGIFIFLLMIVGYFFLYAQYNSPLNYFYYLWSQSSERTPLENPLGKVFLHLFSFPLDVLSRFLPASALVIFLFRKDIFKVLKENAFVWFCTLMFLANILVYWISPGTRPRYLFMFFPLLTIVFTYFYFKSNAEGALRKKYFQYFTSFMIALLLIAPWVLHFVPDLNFLSRTYIWVLAICLNLATLLVLVFQVRSSQYQLLTLVSFLIILRFAYNFTSIPAMKHKGEGIDMYNHAVKIHKIVKDKDLYIHRSAYEKVSLATIFYLERSRQAVVSYEEKINTQDYFILFQDTAPNKHYKTYYRFNYHDNKLLLVKFKD